MHSAFLLRMRDALRCLDDDLSAHVIGPLRNLVHARRRSRDGRGVAHTMPARCLYDTQRTSTLARIVAQTMPAGVVADLGAGTGVLGFTAAHAGARLVMMVEQDPLLVTFLHDAAKELGYARASDGVYVRNGTTVEIHACDARVFVPSTTLDALLCEMVDTGLVHEDAVGVLQHMRAYISPGALVYPQCALLQIGLRSAYDEGKCAPLSLAIPYHSIDFLHEDASGISAQIDIPILASGRLLNAWLRTQLLFPYDVSVDKFKTLCDERTVFFANADVAERQRVRKGDVVHVRLAYAFGNPDQRIALDYLGTTTA